MAEIIFIVKINCEYNFSLWIRHYHPTLTGPHPTLTSPQPTHPHWSPSLVPTPPSLVPIPPSLVPSPPTLTGLPHWSPPSLVPIPPHRYWEACTGHCLSVMRGHTAEVNAVVMTTDGSKAASGSADNTIMVWNVDRKSR